jgi:acetyl esterase
MDTGSYHQFAEGYWLRREAMIWFWDQYTTDDAQRAEITASPLRATADDLAGLPKASSSTARPTCCGTRARPTPATCARPVSM